MSEIIVGESEQKTEERVSSLTLRDPGELNLWVQAYSLQANRDKSDSIPNEYNCCKFADAFIRNIRARVPTMPLAAPGGAAFPRQ